MCNDAEEMAIRTPETLSDQIYGQFLKLIVSGSLKQGDKLPSECQICTMFGVSRSLIRDALRKLQDDQVAEARPGFGVVVRQRPSKQLIVAATARSVSGMIRVMEARMFVEEATARLAAQRSKPQDITKIKAALKQFEAQMERRDVTGDGDFEFHLAIAQASGNEAFVTMLRSIRTVSERANHVALSMTQEDYQTRIDCILQEHRQIYHAILAHDPDAAGLAMAYHLLQARQRVTDCSGRR